MAFDAQAARALAKRSRGAADILTDWKRAVVEAAERGQFEVSVEIPDPVPVPAGKSVNTAAFLLEHLQQRKMIAWAEALQQALNAGYTARPVWRPMDAGAGCEGVSLNWSHVQDAPRGPLQLMSAAEACKLSLGARAQHVWVEKACDQIRKVAEQGAAFCTLHDTLPMQAEAWADRRARLQKMGFTTELVRSDTGAELIVRW